MNNDHEKELRLVLNGKDFAGVATFTSETEAHLEVGVDRNLTVAERKGFSLKLPSIERRCAVFKAVGCTSLTVESTLEAEAREAAAKPVSKKAPKTPKKRSAKNKADQELQEVRAALKDAGISRAKLIRVLESCGGSWGSISMTNIKKII